jgi:hypothetical protein
VNASHEAVLRRHLKGARSLCGNHPLPLLYWRFIRFLFVRVFRWGGSISPEVTAEKGAALSPPELRQLLLEDVLGEWSIDRSTVEFLWRKVHSERPRVILETGAGISTLMFALYAKSVVSRGEPAPTIISIDQTPWVKEKLDQRLQQNMLGENVHILCAPFKNGQGYEFADQSIYDILGSARADWLLVDGPCGPEGCRVSTLQRLGRFCKARTTWFLDDSFREGELQVLMDWSRWPGVKVKGIYPLGKGLGTGSVDASFFRS